MNLRYPAIALVLGTAFASASFAQNTATDVQRDVNQQQRIEQGLKSGELTTKEAAKLEQGEAHVDRMESQALKNGKLSPEEKARIQRAQNAESKEIHALKTNGATGNPDSRSSERMQKDVQRDINQEKRIDQGVKSGALTNKEAGRLEQGQARVDRKEAQAGANGHVGAREQASIQHTENVQSKRIFNKKHNAATRL